MMRDDEKIARIRKAASYTPINDIAKQHHWREGIKMRVPNEGDAIRLRWLIDDIGLYETLSVIASICADKAKRASDNNNAWMKAGAEISAVSDSNAVKDVDWGQM